MKKLLLTLSFILLSCQLAYSAPLKMAVTVAGAGDGTGVSGGVLEWDNAMSEAQFETDIEGFAEAGDEYYILSGTYTLDSAYSTALDGAIANPIKIIGVKPGTVAEPPTTTDWAYGTDRPYFYAAASESWGMSFDNYWHFYNLRVTITFSNGFNGDVSCLWYNCKVQNTDADANSDAFDVGGANCRFINCEAISDLGQAIENISSGTTHFYGCYIHDSLTGIQTSETAQYVIDCIFDTLTTGFALSETRGNIKFKNNTFYNCTTGISLVQAVYLDVISNIFDECTTEISNSVADLSEYVDYNCWDTSPTTTNVVQGGNKVELDPILGAPGSGNFTLGSGSPCIDTGLKITTNQGVSTNNKFNSGVDQDDNAAGGATTDVFGWVD